MDAKPGTKNGDELDVLTTLVEAYEAKHHAIYPPDPIETIKFRMDQLGMTRKDLEAMLGGRGRVSEILAKKRDLSLESLVGIAALRPPIQPTNPSSTHTTWPPPAHLTFTGKWGRRRQDRRRHRARPE